MAWAGRNGRSLWVGARGGWKAAQICRSALGRRWRASGPRAAQAARAFLAVSVTSTEAACAHFTPPFPRAGSTRNCVASGIFSHLPLPTTPAAQKSSRLDSGGVPARSQEVLRRRGHDPNIGPPWHLRGDFGAALPANRSLATRLQAVPTAGEVTLRAHSALDSPLPPLTPFPLSYPAPTQKGQLSPSRDLGNP